MAHQGRRTAKALLVVVAPSVGLSICIVATSADSGQLGVSSLWAWLLTGLQILGMWLVGRGSRFGWLLGLLAQPGWTTYALLSGNLVSSPAAPSPSPSN